MWAVNRREEVGGCLDDRVVNKEATFASQKLVHFTKRGIIYLEENIVISRGSKITLLKWNMKTGRQYMD